MDCPHNPFAIVNYEAFLDLEAKVTTQLSRMLAAEASPTLARELAAVIEREDIFTFQALHSWHLYGEGRVAKWMEEGRFDDWKNDDRAMLDCLATTRPALLEFHEMRDELSWMAVDLMRPEESSFLAIDGGAAARAGRHVVILTWIYDIPAGKKIAVTALEVSAVVDLMPVEILERTLRHLGADEGNRDRWIQENMTLLGEAFSAISSALRHESDSLIESDEIEASYSFDPRAFESIIEAFESSPRIVILDWQAEERNMVVHILEDDSKLKVPGIADVLGSINIESDTLSVFTHGKDLSGACRNMVETLGLSLVFQGERIPEPSHPPARHDKDLVPDELLGRGQVAMGHPRYRLDDGAFHPALPSFFDSTFADEPHFLLDGRTPRNAALDPSLRNRLVALMKGYFRVCDKLRREGEDVDIAPLALELGLQEIAFPAPPLGDEEDFDEESPEIALTTPPPQPLLEGEELDRRLQAVFKSDETLRDHQLRLVFVFEALKNMESGFNFDERTVLFAAVTAAVGTMHPEKPADFLPDTERMAQWYRLRSSTGDTGEMLDDYMTRIAEETRQPEVVEIAYRMIDNAVEERRFKIRSKRVEQLYTAACAAIWEAAHWPVKLNPA